MSYHTHYTLRGSFLLDPLMQALIETLPHSPHLQMWCMFLQTSLFGRTVGWTKMLPRIECHLATSALFIALHTGTQHCAKHNWPEQMEQRGSFTWHTFQTQRKYHCLQVGIEKECGPSYSARGGDSWAPTVLGVVTPDPQPEAAKL